MIEFRTEPESYRHWTLRVEPPLARLTLRVTPDGGLRSDDYELKQNSYDLGVDIELRDAVERLRLEHPEVRCVVLESSHDRVFCAGANIGMLRTATHHEKVNFCKLTNETRLSIEEASRESGQRYLCAIRGTAAGGGYELALACDWILLADDGSSAVSLPEVALLGVLPGTGGLTRLVDKRGVRRDRADVFCTLEEGVRGRKALEWGLVDELAPRSKFAEAVLDRARKLADGGPVLASTTAYELAELEVDRDPGGLRMSSVEIELDRDLGVATVRLLGPREAPHGSESRADFWPLQLARELDLALLHLRFEEPTLGIWKIVSSGSLARVAEYDALLLGDELREVHFLWGRVLRRLEMSSRTVFALVEPGSCFSGFLAELVFAADRSYHFEGEPEDPTLEEAEIQLSAANFGAFPMYNGLSRLATRFQDDDALAGARELVDQPLDAATALEVGLVTEIFDDIDWDDEIRLAIEERASFSPDALSGLEANLRFPGPETLATKIFARLSAWQNWIFTRPNAAGESSALSRYGSGVRPEFDRRRI